MIRSIRLVNWRSHADTKLDFRAGTNLLVGIMGAGKTSVLEAISFAFFGTIPALERRKAKLDDIIRLNETECRAELVFDWNASTYSVSRIIERTKRATSTSAELYRDDSLIESGSVAVTTYIQNLTGVDYDLFTRAIYSEQNNMDYFLNLDPRRRKQEIDALLGLDRFEEARTNVVSVIGRMKSKKDGLVQRYDPQKSAKLASDETVYRKKLEEAEKHLADATRGLDKIKVVLQGLESEFKKMDADQKQHEKLGRESLRLSTLSDSLSNEIRTLDEEKYKEAKASLAKLSGERASILSRCKALDADIARLSKEIGVVGERIKNSSENARHLTNMEADLKAELKGRTLDRILSDQMEAEKKLLDCDSERKAIGNEIKEIEDLSPRLKKASARCPLCHSVLDESSVIHIQKEKEEALRSKKERLKSLDEHHTGLKKKHETLESEIRKCSLLGDRIVSLKKDIAIHEPAKLESTRIKTKEELSRLNGEKAASDKRLDECNIQIEALRVELNRQEALLAKRKALGSVQKDLALVGASLKAILFDPVKFDATRSDLEKARLGINNLSSAKASAQSDANSALEMLKVLSSEMQTSRQLEQDIKHLSKLDEELSIFKNALLSTQVSLRMSLIDAINGAMNDIWPMFYPYRNYASLRLNVTEKDYVFEVDDNGAWKGLESMASGGERASAALTLRVALAMVLTPQLGWLILDEPTHNLDKEAIDLLSDALQTKIPQVVKQAFVITHEEGLMGSEFASSYRLIRDKSRNGDTKAEVI